MQSACQILCEEYGIKAKHLDCTAHVIHNVMMRDFLKQFADQVPNDLVAKTLGNLRRIHGKLSYKLGEIAEKSKSFNTLNGLLMIKENSDNFDEVIDALRTSSEIFQASREGTTTRWNSLFNMCTSFYGIA